MKNVLITGASGDIGASIAYSLAASNRTLLLHYHLNQRKIEEVKRICEQAGATVECIQADLSVLEGADELLKQVHVEIDTLIHAAGQSLQGLLTDMSDDELSKIMHTHLLNPIKITRELLPHMVHKKAGKIVGISSIWGVIGASYEVVYASAKAGLNGFIKSLAKEVAPSGIQVNAVAPGAIETTMLHTYSTEELADLTDEIPAGRLGLPKDVADMVCFLVSDQSSYVNGQILEVNGAWN